MVAQDIYTDVDPKYVYIRRDLYDEISRVLAPTESESLIAAAKRCAAMAKKLPRRAAQCKSLKERATRLQYMLRSVETCNRIYERESKYSVKAEGRLRRGLHNWERKSDTIARCLFVKEGETLVQAARRVMVELMTRESSEAIWRTRAETTLKEREELRGKLNHLMEKFGPCLDPANVYGLLAANIRGVTEEEIKARVEELARTVWGEILKQRQVIAAAAPSAPSDGQEASAAAHPV